ncbi:hypothetical protein [Halostella pelagica]|uniref:hypothetical protein n=1 Tax=Halostella pelagica TaxID=2583824 RepID=UPI001081D303|nr:hypothetical protein [Halostella pelagica]
MEQRTRETLESAGVLLAATTAGIHLMLGVERLTYYLMASRPLADPRQALFVLSGAAIFLGVTLWYRGLRRDVVYAAGILLMLGYLVGWLFLGGHEGQYAWEAGHHGGSPLVGLYEHVTEEITLFATKVIELTLLGILILLLYDARTNGGTVDDRPNDTGADDDRPTDERPTEAGEGRAEPADGNRVASTDANSHATADAAR